MKRNEGFDNTTGVFDSIAPINSFRMTIRSTILLCFVALGLSLGGCCWRRAVPTNGCPTLVSEQVPLSVSAKSVDAGVETNFDMLPDYDSIKQSVLAQVATPGTMAITLDETICLAAQNSQLAEVIDQERHLLKCQQGDRCQKSTIDMVLQGESLEQRNTVAGAAGELFLGLTQISLQLELLDEADAYLAELQTKIDAADEAGFATADGKNELQKGQLEIQRQRCDLDSVHQKLTWQLNMLVNPNSDTAVVLQPVHQLNPQPISIDVRAETQFAKTNRAGIRATQMALAADRQGLAAYRLLKLFDSRLGLKLDTSPVKKQLLRKQLIELISQVEQPDLTLPNRKQQANKIVELRKREAAVSVGKALLDRQTAFEKLTIIVADINRLNRRRETIVASKELDAKDSYLAETENWTELQKAKSDRIAAAIEFEVAALKLKQAKGTLIQSCGFQLDSACGTCSCRCQR